MENEDELTEYQVVKVLHEPLAPYLATVLNTLTHLVQGLVLAALFYVISIQEQFTPVIVCNLIISFGLVIAIWHNIITTNQYHVIRATVFDTFFPIVLAVSQCMLALAVDQPFYIFNILYIVVFIMLDLYTLNNYIKAKNPKALVIFKEHFKEMGMQFAQDLYSVYMEYGKAVFNKTSMIIILFSILTLFLYYLPLNMEIKTYISTIVFASFLIMANYLDLNHRFNNSEKLKKYGYKW